MKVGPLLTPRAWCAIALLAGLCIGLGFIISPE